MKTVCDSAPAGINRRLTIQITESLTVRFWRAVEIKTPDECWPWTASLRSGYGAIKHMGEVLSAHRVSYVLAHGEPPTGTIVQHTCDNRACCNPFHLIADSVQRNNVDARHRCAFNRPEGTAHPASVLTEQQVSEAWELERKDNAGFRHVADTLGISAEALKGVFDGTHWKHVMPEWAKRRLHARRMSGLKGQARRTIHAEFA